MDTKQNINDFDFPSLLGIKNSQESNRLMQDLDGLIWDEFWQQKASEELKTEEIAQINSMVDEGKSVDELIKFLIGKAPWVKGVMVDLMVKIKKEVMEDFYHEAALQTDQALSYQSLSRSEQKIIEERKNKYIKAAELLKKEEWEQLLKLMIN